jgi:hypothetical protein
MANLAAVLTDGFARHFEEGLRRLRLTPGIVQEVTVEMGARVLAPLRRRGDWRAVCPTIRFACLSVVLLAAPPAFAQASAGRPRTPASAPDVPTGTDPLLVILSATGADRDGLPVVVTHPEPGPYLSALTRGYSGRLLRLYSLAQRFADPSRAPQPAYLVLSDHQGGFPRIGFYYDGPQPRTAWVDLHRDKRISGRAGAMDQIFPHELLHVIVQDLAGEMPRSHATQVHAIGVKTDRVTAFNEGFAEHGQLMAIEDADAPTETRALAADTALRDRAYHRMASYRRAVAARWSLAPKARMTFPLWFSGAEHVLRYHAVRENLYSREPEVPRHLYSSRRAYDAYLLENVLPGTPAAGTKSAARMLATEGVVSTLFYRLVNTPAIRSTNRDEAFYLRFGTTREEIDELENAYLKIFVAIREGGYDAVAVVAAYGRLFPDERTAVEAVWRETFLGQPASAREIWLLNRDFRIGTSLFDQFRGSPRAHAFDLNAASMADLMGVPGLDAAVASEIVESAPFASLDDLAHVPRFTPALISTFRGMEQAMREPSPTGVEGAFSLRRILMPYVWRALAVWVGCALVGALCYRALRPVRRRRLVLIGAAAAFTGLVVGWSVDTSVAALAAPVVLFGLPGAGIALWRSHSATEAVRILVAWAGAAIPAALAVTPLG